MRLSRLARLFVPNPSLPPPARGASASARLLAATVLLALGCSHPTTVEAPREPATLRIRNLGDFEWIVALESASGQAAPGSPWMIPPRGERKVAVPAGEYRLRQSLVGTDPSPRAEARAEGRERETIQLRAGRNYTWPLATLLAQPEDPGP